MKKVKTLRIFLIILIVLWTWLIFSFSSQDGGESSGLSRKVVEFFVKDPDLVNKIEPYARKIAHFSEYGLGGILFISLFSTYNWTDRRKITTSILLGAWYAIMDELYQLMIPGRSGALKDVYIDSLGIATGVIGMLIVIKIFEKLKNKMAEDDNMDLVIKLSVAK